MLKLLLFTSPKCVPCKTLKSNLEKIKDSSMELQEMDVTSDAGIDTALKYHITSVPTLCIMKENKELDRIVGSKLLVDLKKILGKYKDTVGDC